ncbi:MAG: adenylate/guanylate cyclase domain-containing protein [Gammaproteobacteria bacterium]
MRFSLPTGTDWMQSLLILTVFVLFAGHALGMVDFTTLSDGGPPMLNLQMLRALLDGRLPAAFTHADVLTFLGLGLILALVLPALPPVGASLVTLLAMAPPFYIAWAFPVPPSLVPLEYSLLTILVLFSVNVLSSYFVETHERQKLMAAFGQYVPPAVVRKISRRPEAFSMAGEARELTVLFCDIKRFTSIAEKLEARELALLLNHYLTAMTDVLHEHGATIDKYIGDAIMAFWGAPMPQDDHAARAIDAALAMQRRMISVRSAFIARGWPSIDAGIGIASGTMNVGNMGSRYRIAYTVIGDAVNLAARLEALTRFYAVDILVSAATRAACPAQSYREIDYVRVKGKAAPQRIYQPLADGRGEHAMLRTHAAGLAAYYAGDWDAARQCFDALRSDQASGRYYDVMLERMAHHEVPPDWDGIVSFGGASSYSMSADAARDDGLP